MLEREPRPSGTAPVSSFTSRRHGPLAKLRSRVVPIGVVVLVTLAPAGLGQAQSQTVASDFDVAASRLCAKLVPGRVHMVNTLAAAIRGARRQLTADGRVYDRLAALTPPPGERALWGETVPGFAKLQAARFAVVAAAAGGHKAALARADRQATRLSGKLARRFVELGLPACVRIYTDTPPTASTP